MSSLPDVLALIRARISPLRNYYFGQAGVTETRHQVALVGMGVTPKVVTAWKSHGRGPFHPVGFVRDVTRLHAATGASRATTRMLVGAGLVHADLAAWTDLDVPVNRVGLFVAAGVTAEAIREHPHLAGTDDATLAMMGALVAPVPGG